MFYKIPDQFSLKLCHENKEKGVNCHVLEQAKETRQLHIMYPELDPGTEKGRYYKKLMTYE